MNLILQIILIVVGIVILGFMIKWIFSARNQYHEDLKSRSLNTDQEDPIEEA